LTTREPFYDPTQLRGVNTNVKSNVDNTYILEYPLQDHARAQPDP
jgi:hypothetical protein